MYRKTSTLPRIIEKCNNNIYCSWLITTVEHRIRDNLQYVWIKVLLAALKIRSQVILVAVENEDIKIMKKVENRKK